MLGVNAAASQNSAAASLRLVYVSQIMFDVGITFAKFSALLFFFRVFAVRTRGLNVALWATSALVAIFILFKLPAQTTTCIPPRKD